MAYHKQVNLSRRTLLGSGMAIVATGASPALAIGSIQKQKKVSDKMLQNYII